MYPYDIRMEKIGHEINGIEIRAWDKVENRMRYDYVGKSGDGKGDWVIFFGETLDNPFPRERFDLMLCIGIKDKHKQDIYENDILFDGKGYGIVCYLMEDAAFVVSNKGKDEDENAAFYHINSDGILKDTEIVGNTYESPELTKDW